MTGAKLLSDRHTHEQTVSCTWRSFCFLYRKWSLCGFYQKYWRKITVAYLSLLFVAVFWNLIDVFRYRFSEKPFLEVTLKLTIRAVEILLTLTRIKLTKTSDQCSRDRGLSGFGKHISISIQYEDMMAAIYKVSDVVLTLVTVLVALHVLHWFHDYILWAEEFRVMSAVRPETSVPEVLCPSLAPDPVQIDHPPTLAMGTVSTNTVAKVLDMFDDKDMLKPIIEETFPMLVLSTPLLYM